MENRDASTISKAWLLFSVSTLGMLVFAALYFLTPKTPGSIETVTQFITNTVTNTVTNVVTNEVVKEVPKEVEKIVKVPAQIPEDYVTAMNVLEKMRDATYTGFDRVLYKMKDVRAVYTIDRDVLQLVSEDQVKAKFELALRRNNVPISPKSQNVVDVVIDGFFQDSANLVLNYAIRCELNETQTIFRDGEGHRATVRVWSKGNSFGVAGKNKASDVFLSSVEKCAEVFANDFLSANPKPQ